MNSTTTAESQPMAARLGSTQKAKPLSEEREQELLKDAVNYIYQSEADFECSAHCFFPEDHQASDPKPAVVFFHGGLWDVSMSTQFAPHAMHFASRGMVAVCANYRVNSKQPASTPEDAVEDAAMAVLWLKHNATELGIDPQRICVAGAASGAHMALSLAMRPECLEMGGWDSRPHCVIALSAIVNTTKKGQFQDRFRDPKVAQKLSPSSMVKKGLPPTLLVHGKADTISPYEHIAKFAKAMKRKKNQVDLVDFEAMNHSFFNFNVSATHFEITLNSMDAFLTALGFIEPADDLI